MRVRNLFGNRYSGTLGDDLVAVEGPTMNYLRKYAKPSNPNPERQRIQRGRFAQSLVAWQGLSHAQMEFYNGIEPPRRGYDVFMSRAMLALGRGEPIEVPLRMSWMSEGGPIEGAVLIVRRRNVLLFEEPLRAMVEVALTVSDVPYTFVLARGFKEDSVLALGRSWNGDPPGDLMSMELGIGLSARGPDTASPPAHAQHTRTIRENLTKRSAASSPGGAWAESAEL